MVNRYIAAYMCLYQGHRVGNVTNFTVKEWERAETEQPVIEKGEARWTVFIGIHKMDLKFQAKFVYDVEWRGYLQKYYKHVRRAITDRTERDPANFILQHDGKPFNRVSQGITTTGRNATTKIYREHLRSSLETYSQRQAGTFPKAMAKFLCHSEKVSDGHYLVASRQKGAAVLGFIKKLRRYHKKNNVPTDQIPEDLTTAPAETSKAQETPKCTPMTTPKTSPVKSPPKTMKIDKAHFYMKYLSEKVGGNIALMKLSNPTDLVAMD